MSTDPLNKINRRILVIDDNHAIHEDFRKILCAPESADALADQEKELFGEAGGKEYRRSFPN